MRTGSFETDAKRAEKRMKEMDATIKKWGVGIGAAVGASTAAFTAMVVKAAETGAELQRMAALSASSTTAFQEWAYGAKSVGIEQDKLADILKDTQDKLGEFLQTGGGPLKDFFENIAPKVGATAEEFRKLSGPQALELYFQSLEKAKLNQAEMTFYMEALASDSSKLAPLLRNNGTGLKAMADQAHSLGIILKEDAVANAAAFNKTLESMGQVAKGAFFELSSGAISALNSYTDHVLKAKTATDSWLSAMKAAAYYEVFGDKDPTKELANAIKMATEAEQTLVNFRSGMGSILSDSQREVAEAPIKDQIKAANEYLALIQRMSAHSAATPMLPAIEVAAGNGKGKPKDTKTRTDEGQKLIDQMNERIALFGKETEYEKLLAQISMGSMQFRTQAQQEEALGSAQTLDFLEKEAAAYKENQEHLEALAKVSQDTSEQMSEFAVQAARNIQTSLGDGLYDLLTGNFDNIGARFGEMVLRMASDAAAANLAGALFGDYGKTGQIGGLLGGLAASVLGSTISASCSYVSAGPAMGSWEGLSHFAAGGYTGAGGKYDPAGIVHAGEYVIPADATKRLGVGFLDRLKGYADGGYVGASGMPASAGGSTRVEIINNGTPQQVTGVRQSMDLRGEIISIFVDDMRKNGRSARAVQGVVGR
ncbi:phage tail tape measure protein [Achromobacter veterisilvae]|nr:phage tail tape measure protein [Achromobacter veterisilvae]